MSLAVSKVEKLTEYTNTNYCSGDGNGMKYKQFYQEENNNEVDELTKDFSEMGCIVDAVKRPPNICIETCVYEEPTSENDDDQRSHKSNSDNEEVLYSDEFEDEDMSDIELDKPKNRTVHSNGNSKTKLDQTLSKSSVKLSKSQSCMSRTSQKPGSVSGRSTDYGSVSVPQTRRINMSFTNDRLREIERHNHILLNKILSARNKRRSSIPPRDERPRRPPPPAAVQRRNLQRKIDHENMVSTNDEIERHDHILLNEILSARNKRRSSIPPRDERPRRPPPPAAVQRRNLQRKIDHENMVSTNDEIERHDHILLNEILSARNKRRSSIPPRDERPRRPPPPAAVQRRNLQRKIDHENMVSTNDEIERHDHILLNEILSARNKRRSSIPPRDERPRRPPPPAAVQRRNLQRKIDHENMILLKKIQRAKSSACSIRR